MSFVAVVTHAAAQKEHLAVAMRLDGEGKPSTFAPICSQVSTRAPWAPVQNVNHPRPRPMRRRCRDCQRALAMLTQLAREWEEVHSAPSLDGHPPQA